MWGLFHLDWLQGSHMTSTFRLQGGFLALGWSCSNLSRHEYERINKFWFQSILSGSNVTASRSWSPAKAGIVPGGLNNHRDFLCLRGHSANSRASLNLFFEYSGEAHCDRPQQVPADMSPSPSKAHVQTARAGDTSGAQVFENMETFGPRYLNRSDSENHPAKDSENRHSSTTRQACRSIRNCRRQVERRCRDWKQIKAIREWFKVRFRFRFLTVRQ